jgi:molybdenum cofactor biosynthesis protein B
MSEDAGPKSSSIEHRESAARPIGVSVLTVSDTRTEETDTSGSLIKQMLTAASHHIESYRIVRDEPAEILATIGAWTDNPGVEAIISNGGTGIARRDTTYDVLAGLLEKRLDGFGELFRMLSYQEIGAAAMLSRAVAGTYRNRVLIALPGSSNAVKLGMEKLIVPELAHLVYELRK